eukprot:8932523-Pyramimonas_sp.AAC.1
MVRLPPPRALPELPAARSPIDLSPRPPMDLSTHRSARDDLSLPPLTAPQTARGPHRMGPTASGAAWAARAAPYWG